MDQNFTNRNSKILYYLFPRGFIAAAAVAFRGTQSNQKCINRDVQWYFHTALIGFVIPRDLEKR